MTLGKTIKRLREGLGLSQQQLAESVSTFEGLSKPLSWQTVQQWEDNKTAPRMKRMQFVAQALRIDVIDLHLENVIEGRRDTSHAYSTRRVQSLRRATRPPAKTDVREVLLQLGVVLAAIPSERRATVGSLLDGFAKEGGAASYVEALIAMLDAPSIEANNAQA